MDLSVPAWAQQIAVFAVAVLSVILGVYKYIKTEAGKSTNPASATGSVVAASFIDSRLLRELIDTLREHQEELGRQSQRLMRSNTDLREAIIDSNEALRVQTDATLNMLRFITRQSYIKGDTPFKE